jgi:hypothetical protein
MDVHVANAFCGSHFTPAPLTGIIRAIQGADRSAMFPANQALFRLSTSIKKA